MLGSGAVTDRIEGANVDHACLSNALLNSAKSLERQQGGDREIRKHGVAKIRKYI